MHWEVFKPLKEIVSFTLLAKTINIGQYPGIIIEFRSELDGDGEVIDMKSCPEKICSSHVISRPPYTPIEGRKWDFEILLGDKFLMNSELMSSFLVSCKHIMEHLVSSVLLAIVGHFLGH